MVNRCTLFHVGSLFLLFCFVAFFPVFLAEPTLVVVQRWKKGGEGKRTTRMHFVDVVRIVGLNFSKCHARYLSCQDGIGPRANIHARCTDSHLAPLLSQLSLGLDLLKQKTNEIKQKKKKKEKEKYEKKSKQNGTKIKNRREN